MDVHIKAPPQSPYRRKPTAQQTRQRGNALQAHVLVALLAGPRAARGAGGCTGGGDYTGWNECTVLGDCTGWGVAQDAALAQVAAKDAELEQLKTKLAER